MCSSIPKPKLPNIIIKLLDKKENTRKLHNCTLTVIGEVSLAEFEFLNLEATLDELLSLVAADGDVDGDLLVSLYGESSDSVAGTGLDGLLVGEILEYLGGLGQLIARLTSAQVEDELFNLDLSHVVVELDLLLLLWFHIFFLSLLTY